MGHHFTVFKITFHTRCIDVYKRQAFINCELEFISLQNLKNMFMKQMNFFLVALMAVVMGMSRCV